MNRKVCTKWTRLGLLLLVALLMSSMMSISAFAEDSTQYKKEIHIALNALPDTFDLVNTTSTVATTITVGSVYETLVTIDSAFQTKPELAESFEINDDATKYTYKLRSGVKFHNGEIMTAEDVIASMNRWIDNYEGIRVIAGDNRFVVESEDTVSISFDEPYLYLNEAITKSSQRPMVVPASVIADADPATGLIKDYIGTGPYVFDEWAADRYVLLTKYEDYIPYGVEGDLSGWYGYKTAATENVYYDVVKDAATRTAGMISGEYDFSYNMSPDDYFQFADESLYEIYPEGTGQLIMVYNKKEGIASDAVVRQAVNAALNNSDILRAAYIEDAFVHPEGSFMLAEDSEWYTQVGTEFYNQNDPEKAKELLSSVGYDGEEFRIVVASDHQDFYNAALVIEQNLKAADINVVLVVVDWATYLSLSKDETAFDAYITSCSLKVIPTQLYYLDESAGWATIDPRISELKQTINSSSNKLEAIATWLELQEYMWSENVPVSMIGNSYIYSVASKKVENMIYFEGPHAWDVKVVD